MFQFVIHVIWVSKSCHPVLNAQYSKWYCR